MNTNVTMIPVAQLHPHPDNPRKDLGDITELTASIKANGVLQNLTVVPRANPDVNYEKLCRQYYADPTEENRTKLNQFRNTDGYTVIIGHRRLAAAKAAGLMELPCIVVEDMFWATVEDRYIAAGQTHGDVTAECMTAGASGNGYLAGQIATIVDVFDYYTSCTNLTESGGGSDAPTDDEFYEQLRQSEDNYSTAGPKGGYIAKAKAVSNDIADVLPNSPTPGEVRIYVLMEDGTIAGQEVKNAVLAACNADETRPLTDHVLVEDPETVEYDIDATYYLNRGGPSAADVQSEVNAAVDAYVKWQAGKLGRDINPSELTRRMMVNGVKRVVIRSPVYTELRSGNVATDASGRVALADLTDTVPQVGKLRGRTVTSGGYEDE